MLKVKGYVRFTGVVTGPHALDRLHHAGVGPAAPAAALVTLVTHRDFQIGQHSARRRGAMLDRLSQRESRIEVS